jgi:WD40 repeat protein/serine/threonine protein kinase/DNA-binding XRE family transcriptional regulator
MMAEQSFGMLAKNRRRELGLTQDELARRVGCAPITIRKMEADDLRPSVQIAERMAMALNIPLEERAAFVKLARLERTPAEEPKVTPMPALEEIGNADLSGRAIRGYALGERLGSGGMGAVYRAVQPLVEREVAIKIILPKYANHPDFIRRFEAEAQLVARLEHPHIVPLYDYWREPGVAYLVMRLLRGGSVQSLLRTGSALPPATVLRIVEQLGSALSAAHRAGVVHRDLKPANVLLDEDNNAYLADFGIAKNLSNFSSETQADMVIGSPDYISPEQIRSEFIRPQTDIYALGVMLYELLTGTVPFRGPTPFDVMHQHLSTPLPPLSASRVGLPGALDDIIKHATAKDPIQRYETVEEMLNDLRGSLGQKLSSAKEKLTGSQETLLPLKETINPYKGLRAFGEGDAQDFFGREALLQQLLIRLGEGGELSRFLTVVGPSGSGKSSVVKAGLIPALRRGALPGSENWFILEMMPGVHPLEELEAALLRVAVNPPASLIEQFQSDNRGLIRAVRRCLPNDPRIELMLVIDQFEEVFTLLQDEKERIRFLGLLVSSVLDETSRIRIVITVRADFIDRPLAYMDFGEILRQRMEIVLPLTTDEMESAIVSPAERVGLRLEQGLNSMMMRDLADQPGALPLLQYALTELFEKREANTLTKSAYQKIGGVLGALGRKAEEVFTGLDAECQEIAEQLFLRLVTLGEGVEDTRRRALISELESLQLGGAITSRDYSKSFKTTLEVFGRARLLSFDRDPGTRGPTVEVAHEAILHEWLRLREWLNESRTLVRMQRQLALAALEWESAQCDESFLLIGTKLAQYEGWITNAAIALTQPEINFLQASLIERDRQELQETERQKRELQTAQRLAETERQRAEIETQRANEQTRYAARVRARNRIIAIAGTVAVLLAVLAGAFGLQSNQNLSAAQAANTQTAANAATAEANYQQAESQRLGAEGIALAQVPGGNPEVSALLAIRGLRNVYSPQADAALQLALPRLYTQHVLPPEGREGPLYSIAITPNGRTVFTSDLVLRDAETGEIANYLVTNDDPDPWGTHVSFSPDGRWALAGLYRDHTARIWDVQTGKELQVFSGHTDRVLEGAFSPDGRWVITGSADKTARIWDAATGKEVRVFTEHTDQVQSVAFSPDGKQVLTGSSDLTARLWDVTTGQTSRVFRVDDSDILAEILSVTFSPDGKWILASSAAKAAWLWDAETSELLRQFKGHAGAIRSGVFSSDGKQVLTASDDMTARLWDAETGELLRVFGGHTDGVGKAVFAPDGQSVFTASWDGNIRQWNLGPDERVFALPVLTSSGLFASGIDSILLAGYEGQVAWLTDARTGRELTRFSGHTDKISSVEVSKDKKYVLTGSYDKTARLWDAATGQELRILRGHTDFVNASFSEDGKFILTWSRDKTVRVWAASTGQELRVFQFKSATDMPTAVAISPDNTSVLVNVPDDPIFTMWNIGSGLSRYWDTLTQNRAVVFSLSFSPDGRYILSSANDGKAQVWEWEVGMSAPIQTFNHPDAVNFASYSPDGKFIWTGCADGKVRQWDATTGQLVRIFSGPRGYSQVDDISPDGKFVLIEYDDQSVRLYDVDYHDTIRFACSRLLRDLTSDERAAYNIKDTKPTCPPP